MTRTWAMACGLGWLLLLAGEAWCESPQAASMSPRVNYMLQCQGCHLADGTGAPGAVPSLRGTMARFLTVPGGREYLVRVPGSAQSPLSDRDLARVLNWMVVEFGPQEVARSQAPYTEAEVAQYRRTPLLHAEAMRNELLAKLESVDPAARGR